MKEDEVVKLIRFIVFRYYGVGGPTDRQIKEAIKDFERKQQSE